MVCGNKFAALVLRVIAVWVVFQTTSVYGGQHLKESLIRAFSPNEFNATYELMTQYKSGLVADCPQVIKYKAVPTEVDQDLVIAHNDMMIGAERDNAQQCTDDGEMRLTLSNNLVDDRLLAFQAKISEDIYTRMLFNDISQRLQGKRYYVSVSDSPRKCGVTWFTGRETFIFFDESVTTPLTVVLKISNGQPKLLPLPLIANIRYMIAVREGSTCIYRVDVDVSNVMNDIARPSDSPSPTATPSPTPSTSISPTISPTPSVTPSVSSSMTSSPTESPSTSVSTSPSISPSTSGSVTPSSVPKISLSPVVSPSSTQTPTITVSPSSTLPSASAEGSPSQSSSNSPRASPRASTSNTPSPSALFDTSTGSISPTVTPTPVSVPVPSNSASSTPSQSPTPSQSFDPNDPANQVVGGDRNSTDLVDGSSTCFPSSATVRLESGARIALTKLAIGNRVLSGNGGFSEVLAFTHANPIAWTRFVRMTTSGGQSLSLTTSHYLPINGLLSRAGEVRVGDVVRAVEKEQGSWRVIEDHVVSVELHMERGLYNPQTASGDIVVDGVITSCYTDAFEPWAAHALLAPLRGLAHMRARCLSDIIASSIGRVSNWVTG